MPPETAVDAGPWPGMPQPGAPPAQRTGYGAGPRARGPELAAAASTSMRPPAAAPRPSGYSSGAPRPRATARAARVPRVRLLSGAARPAGSGYAGAARPGARPGSPAPGARPGAPASGRAPATRRGGDARPRRAHRRPAAGRSRPRDKDRDKKKKGVKKPSGIAAETDAGDLRSYRGTVQEIEAAEAEQDTASRRGRRAARNEPRPRTAPRC